MQVGGDETEDLVVITLDEKADCYKLAAKLGVKVKSYYKEDDTVKIVLKNGRVYH